MKSKMGKFIRMICLIFGGWFGKENAKQGLLVCYPLFQEKRFFKKKINTGKGNMVSVFFINIFSVLNFFVRGSIRRRCKTTQIPGKIVSKS